MQNLTTLHKEDFDIKLSIIIPCYNFEKFIDIAIISAMSQKISGHIEIIVGDDCSSDNSPDIIKRFSNWINPVIRPENIGGTRNIEHLLSLAKGQYISYLDGDDYFIDPWKSKIQIDFLDQNPHISQCCTGFITKTGDSYNEPGGNWLLVPNELQDRLITTEDFLYNNHSQWGRVFRNIPGLFKPWMHQFSYLDWCMNYEISKWGPIKCLNFPSGVYRKHPEGWMTKWANKHETECSNIRQFLQQDYNNYKSSK